MNRLPLASVRVLDLDMAAAGAYAARLLADAGAEVIGVETLPIQRPGAASQFNDLNRNKLGCTLDLSRPDGRELIIRLATRCDVVVERPESDRQERPLITYDALRAARPDIIVVSIRGVGRTNGRPDMDDIVAGTAAAGATCVALLHHRNTGTGQHVEVDAADCAVSLVGELVVARALGHEAAAAVAVPLPSARELLRDPRLRERHFFEPVSHLKGGVQEIAGPPWRFSLTPGHVRLPAPEPGQHNRYVFRDLLGLSPEETAGLERRGIIGATGDA